MKLVKNQARRKRATKESAGKDLSTRAHRSHAATSVRRHARRHAHRIPYVGAITSVGADLTLYERNYYRYFYTDPPQDNITLEEFEKYAYDRLRVLKELEAMRARGIKHEEKRTRLETVANQYHVVLLPRSAAEIRADAIAHHVLRLAYCRPADRSWLVQQELDLFNYRVEHKDFSAMEFLKANQMQYATLTTDELSAAYADLNQMAWSKQKHLLSNASNIYKIPFQEALDLVAKRKVIVRAGVAYVFYDDLKAVLSARFRSKLNEGLAKVYKAIPTIASKNTQLVPILDNLVKQYIGSDFKPTNVAGAITLNDLDAVAERSFPLSSSKIGIRVMKDEGISALMKGSGVFASKRVADWTTRYFFAVQCENLLYRRDEKPNGPRKKLSTAQKITASLMGGSLSALSTIPIDVMVAQIQQAKNAGVKVGVLETFRAEYREGGFNRVAGFATKGFVARIAHVAMTTALMKTAASAIFDFLHRNDAPSGAPPQRKH